MTKDLNEMCERLFSYDFSPRTGEDWPQYMGRARKHRDNLISALREYQRRERIAREALELANNLVFEHHSGDREDCEICLAKTKIEQALKQLGGEDTKP